MSYLCKEYRMDGLIGSSMRFCHFAVQFGNSSQLTSIGSITR